jgi:hypothetical protein
MFRLRATGAGNRLKNPRILGVNHGKVKPQLRCSILFLFAHFAAAEHTRIDNSRSCSRTFRHEL